MEAPEAISEAYWTHGVRTFSLDTMDELQKILDATENASDLNLLVRLRVSSDHAKLSLASKFGAEPGETPDVAQQALGQQPRRDGHVNQAFAPQGGA